MVVFVVCGHGTASACLRAAQDAPDLPTLGCTACCCRTHAGDCIANHIVAITPFPSPQHRHVGGGGSNGTQAIRTPAGAQPVPRSSVISIRFDDDECLNQILAGSCPSASGSPPRSPQSLAQLLQVFTNDGQAVDGAVSRDGATVIFTPIAALNSNETYTVRVRVLFCPRAHTPVHDVGFCWRGTLWAPRARGSATLEVFGARGGISSGVCTPSDCDPCHGATGAE